MSVFGCLKETVQMLDEIKQKKILNLLIANVYFPFLVHSVTLSKGGNYFLYVCLYSNIGNIALNESNETFTVVFSVSFV